jgi:hypothetical protein
LHSGLEAATQALLDRGDSVYLFKMAGGVLQMTSGSPVTFELISATSLIGGPEIRFDLDQCATNCDRLRFASRCALFG